MSFPTVLGEMGSTRGQTSGNVGNVQNGRAIQSFRWELKI